MDLNKNSNIRPLEIIVKWLNKTQGRDKLCKLIQYGCLMLATFYKDHDYYSLQFETLFRSFYIILESMKDARKLFRLFKSVIEYQKLIAILLDDDDNLLKVFRVIGQIFFFFYWFFDNISIACKVKLIRGNHAKYIIIASVFWTLSLLISIPVLAIQSKNHKSDPKKSMRLKLDSIKYIFDLLPASKDSLIFQKIFKTEMKTEFAAMGGFVSAAISTYQVLIQC